MKKVSVFLLASAILLAVPTTTHAATPLYKPLSSYGYTGVPNISVTLPDEYKEGINQSVKDAMEENANESLETPVITNASYHHKTYYYGDFNQLKIEWDGVNDAASYEVKITKADGTTKIYTTSKNYLCVKQNADDFVTGCLKMKVDSGWESAKVRIRAINGETYSSWTEETSISCNIIHI